MADEIERTEEFIRCLKGIWESDHFEFHGDFYRFHDYSLKPKPLNTPERPNPEIFQGGNSTAARRNGGLRGRDHVQPIRTHLFLKRTKCTG